MSEDTLKNICNFRLIDDGIATSGQPLREQFRDIKNAGFELIINLARADSPGAIDDEADLVTSMGMQYKNIPVDFAAPQHEDLLEFFELMDSNNQKKVFIHCAFNWRVSVFICLYQVLKLEMPKSRAIKKMRAVWKPDIIWQDFIDNHLGGES